MSTNELKKIIPTNTIPTEKLTVILNNFIVNTTNHLNKLSINVDQRLSEFDKKMNDLEIMTTLFESKLDSLPDEIKSTYPPLQPCNLEDVNPDYSSNLSQNTNIKKENERQENEEKKEGEDNNNKNENEENDKEEEKNEGEINKEEGGVPGEEENQLSPQEMLNKFLEQHSNLQNLYKMLKMGVPIIGVKQKAQINSINMDDVDELIELAKNVHGNIS